RARVAATVGGSAASVPVLAGRRHRVLLPRRLGLLREAIDELAAQRAESGRTARSDSICDQRTHAAVVETAHSAVTRLCLETVPGRGRRGERMCGCVELLARSGGRERVRAAALGGDSDREKTGGVVCRR